MIPLIIASKTIKYLKINLTTELKDFLSEIYKILMKEIENDTKWEDIPYSWIGRINIVKTSILPKDIYRYSMPSLSRVQWYFLQMLKDTSKIYMEPQKTLNGQRNSEEEEQKQEASHSLIGIKNQQTKTELSPEKIPKYIQSTNILTKVPRKDSGFNKPC